MNIDLGFGPIPIGTVPQWVTLAAVLIAAFKLIPELSALKLKRKSEQERGWQTECANLRQELRIQRQECEEEHRQSRAKIHELEETIYGLRRQNIQEQISLINTILRSVDSPELKGLLSMMEAVKDNLASQHVKILGAADAGNEQP